MRPKLRLTDEQKRAELKAACLDKQNGIEAERLQTIKLAYSGHHTMDEIAERVGGGRRSVARWVKAFRQEGVAGLLSNPPAYANSSAMAGCCLKQTLPPISLVPSCRVFGMKEVARVFLTISSDEVSIDIANLFLSRTNM